MQASVVLGSLKNPADIKKLQQVLEELYDINDLLYETADPNASVTSPRGKFAIYYDGTDNIIKVNTDGGTTWERVSTLWEVDGSETQLKTADEIDMQSKKIINLLDPAADQDAATKKFCDDTYSPISHTGRILQTVQAVDATYTLTSSFATVLTQAVTVVAGSTVIVWASGWFDAVANNNNASVQLKVDSTQYTDTLRQFEPQALDGNGCWAFEYVITGLSAGSHDFIIEALSTSNAGTALDTVLIIQEISG